MKAIPKWLIELVVIILAVLLIRATLVQAFNIPSASMQPTLLIGDFILVNKLVYRVSQPRRGDVVVFKYPVNPSLDYIKRVVAVGGDRVEFEEYFDQKAEMKIYKIKVNGKEFPLRYVKLTTDEGKFYHEFEEVIERDGEKIRHRIWFRSNRYIAGGTYIAENSLEAQFCRKWEDYKYSAGGLVVAFREGGMTTLKKCVEFTVPEGYYFVMGDNRDNSEDSRFWGFVPRDNIVGKAFVIYFSGKVPSLTPSDVNIFTGFKQLLIALLHPRAERIGKPLVH
jgi:signal peptidase I